MPRLLDLSGERIGRLRVIERHGTDKFGNALWKCECDCGNEVYVCSHSLKTEHTKSCGCLMREECGNRRRKHGKSKDRLYHVYFSIADRCNNPNNDAYKHYGSRGIKICDEWKNSYEAFEKWAYKNGYKQGLTIDRIDVNGDYEPSNCRWVTQAKQMRNTRKTRRLTYKGKTLPLVEWCEIYSLSFNTVSARYKRGWNNPQEILFGRMKGVKNYG